MCVYENIISNLKNKSSQVIRLAITIMRRQKKNAQTRNQVANTIWLSIGATENEIDTKNSHKKILKILLKGS